MSADDTIHPEAATAPGYLANHAARVFNRNVDARLREHGLSLSLIGPVLLLAWKGPMRQRDLVAHSAVRQPAMVALLDKLEGMGLLTRTAHPDDRRAALITLTAAGERMAALGGEVLRAENARGGTGLMAAEQATLVALLQRFITALEGT
ncbi:DNA-binding transcriptional regulator, MarR family [Sphingomonas guangdongensis]|uniref:DNA-binding transcriptional regulator, MarR family n=1 Tax=Sphingomonas guangdongensis TaxID=1141890 RepID=A0A285QET1_9SPHN|nr:MarR family transcriptional regulator [Sphingomonas guangdongensis]SOB80028.1 DNA-binding transcriptional regulator, MarR family [Sphingomonas guangdongensis]